MALTLEISPFLTEFVAKCPHHVERCTLCSSQWGRRTKPRLPLQLFPEGAAQAQCTPVATSLEARHLWKSGAQRGSQRGRKRGSSALPSTGRIGGPGHTYPCSGTLGSLTPSPASSPQNRHNANISFWVALQIPGIKGQRQTLNNTQ